MFVAISNAFLYPVCVGHGHSNPNVVSLLSNKSNTLASSFEIYNLSIVHCLILNLPNLLEINYGKVVELIEANIVKKHEYFI